MCCRAWRYGSVLLAWSSCDTWGAGDLWYPPRRNHQAYAGEPEVLTRPPGPRHLRLAALPREERGSDRWESSTRCALLHLPRTDTRVPDCRVGRRHVRWGSRRFWRGSGRPCAQGRRWHLDSSAPSGSRLLPLSRVTVVTARSVVTARRARGAASDYGGSHGSGGARLAGPWYCGVRGYGGP